MKKTNLVKTVLIPSLSLVTLGTIAATSTSCAQGSDEPNSPYMVVRALGEHVMLTLNHHNHSTESYERPTVYYSYDKTTWTEIQFGEGQESVSVTINANQKLYLKGDNADGFSVDNNRYSSFSFVGRVSISGSILGLLDNGTGTTGAIPNAYCFYDLFRDCATIVNVSEGFLRAATELKEFCYSGMFYRNVALKNAPSLPVREMAPSCYNYMFNGCAALKKAPDLQAIELGENAQHCYNGIFANCILLQSIKIHYTGGFDNYWFVNWVNNVAQNGVFYYNGQERAENFHLPTTWTVKTF